MVHGEEVLMSTSSTLVGMTHLGMMRDRLAGKYNFFSALFYCIYSVCDFHIAYRCRRVRSPHVCLPETADRGGDRRAERSREREREKDRGEEEEVEIQRETQAQHALAGKG